MQKLNTFLFLLFFATLAAAGIWLLVEPGSALSHLHGGGEFAPGITFFARQTGLGLLLAAGINLFCAVRQDARASLHLLVLIYLGGLVASHGPAAFGSAAWMWIPVAVYALPLVTGWLSRLPVPASLPLPLPGSGQRAGTVKWFNPNKGFGFLVTDDGEEIFVHFRAVKNGGRRSLRQGQKVHFTTRETERGLQADEVVILDKS